MRDDKAVEQAKKWLRKGIRLTSPIGDRLFIIKGRKRDKEGKGRGRRVVAASIMGAIEVGHANEGKGSTDYDEVKHSREADSSFFSTVDVLWTKYAHAYNTTIEHDSVILSREEVYGKINQLY